MLFLFKKCKKTAILSIYGSRYREKIRFIGIDSIEILPGACLFYKNEYLQKIFFAVYFVHGDDLLNTTISSFVLRGVTLFFIRRSFLL